MNNEQIFALNYEKACAMTERLKMELQKRGLRCSMEYMVSYMAYFGKSKLNEPSIKINTDDRKMKNNAICISSYLYISKNPFFLSLWKYYGGEKHIFKYYDFKSDSDIHSLIGKIYDFFGIKEYEQLSLF